MRHKNWLDLADIVGIIIPQLNFLSYVLSVEPDGLSPKDAGGLASILSSISSELQTAILEVPDDPDK